MECFWFEIDSAHFASSTCRRLFVCETWTGPRHCIGPAAQHPLDFDCEFGVTFFSANVFTAMFVRISHFGRHRTGQSKLSLILATTGGCACLSKLCTSWGLAGAELFVRNCPGCSLLRILKERCQDWDKDSLLQFYIPSNSRFLWENFGSATGIYCDHLGKNLGEDWLDRKLLINLMELIWGENKHNTFWSQKVSSGPSFLFYLNSVKRSLINFFWSRAFL